MHYNVWKRKLKLCSDAPYVVAQDVHAAGCVVKRYMGLESLSDLRKAVKSFDNVYEVCKDERIRVYFDIDHKKDGVSDSQVLRRSVTEIKRILNNQGIPVKKKSMLILSACTDIKSSFHVVIPSVVFSDATSRRMFSRSLRNYDCSMIDPAPYGKNCLFRCPFSSKLGKANQLVPVDANLQLIENFDVNSYLLHNDDAFAHEIHLSDECRVPRPAVQCTTTVDHVVDLLRRHGDATSIYRSFRPDPVPSFYFMTGEKRLCLSGSDKVHSNNNFCVYLGADCTIVYRCLSAKCAQFYRVLGNTDSTPALAVKNTSEYCLPRCKEFALNGKMQIIKSEMGTGKTYQVREMLRRNQTSRVLIVCFRVELGQYMCDYLQEFDFTFYQNVTGMLSQEKLICQVNSLHRVMGSQYDILILDEIESIMAQVSGVTASRRRTCWLVLEKLIRDTQNVIALDAAVNERSIQTLKSIRQDCDMITNTYKNLSEINLHETSSKLFFKKLLDSVNSNEPVAITSTSASILLGLRKSMQTLYPQKKVLLIWAESSEDERLQYRSNLTSVDVFMYTATLQAGISIDVCHFSTLYVYATANGPSPAALHQMMARIRTLTQKTIVATFDHSTQSEDDQEWSYGAMVEHITTPVQIALDQRFENDMGAIISGFNKDWSRVYTCTPFFVCIVHNILETFNATRHFRKLFLRQAMQKGYMVTRLSDCWDIGEEATQLLKMAKTEMKLQKNEYYSLIADANDSVDNLKIEECRQEVDAASAERARLKSRNSSREDVDFADRKVKQAVERLKREEKCVDAHFQRMVLAQFYGIGAKEVTLTFLKRCEPLPIRDAYFRLCLTLPQKEITTQSVQQRISEVMQQEGSHLTSNGIIFCIENMQRSTNGMKLALCHQLIRDIGFDHIFDKCNRSTICPCDHIRSHQKSITAAMELKKVQDITDDGSMLRFINQVLSKCYRAKVLHRKKTGVYYIKHFQFPALRYVHIKNNERPCFVSDERLERVKLRI
jgi:hypothetical protein